MSERPLHELDPTGRFGSRAADYAKFRPDYPPACIAAVLSGFHEPRVADIGAGTGISSRMLARAGAFVRAIEPNEGMRANAEADPRVQWADGTAEATGLADGSVDVVACFQAFHWFHAERALAEFHRILARPGRLALVWNERDRSDPFTAAYSELIARFAVIAPAEERAGAADPLYACDLFEGQRLLVFPHHQAVTADDLVGRARSTSYLPSGGAAAEDLHAALRDLHRRQDPMSGVVMLRYRTSVHLATKI